MISKILIIIVTWNKKQYALRLLDALGQIDYPRDSYDILIVDNDSDDGTATAVASEFPDVHLVRNRENLGGSGGFNTGLKRAFEFPDSAYDYLWLLDNDVMVHRKALAELVSTLDVHQDIGVAGSTMMQIEKPWSVNEMGGFLDLKTGRLTLNMKGKCFEEFKKTPLENLVLKDVSSCGKFAGADGIVDVDYVAAASLLVRSAVSRQAGLFRDYFIHFDDVEWCLRLGRLGYRTVASAKSFIWHASTSSRKKIPDDVYYYNNRNLLNLLQDYGENPKVVQRFKRRVWLKSLYFALMGKTKISYLHRKSISDFNHSILGKIDRDFS